MQSGSHKCVSNLAMTEQYNQAEPDQRGVPGKLPTLSFPSSTVWAHSRGSRCGDTFSHSGTDSLWLCTWWQRVCQAWNTFPYNPRYVVKYKCGIWSSSKLGELLLVKPKTKMSGKQNKKKKPYEKKGVLCHWLLDSLLNPGRNGLIILVFMHLSIHINILASYIDIIIWLKAKVALAKPAKTVKYKTPKHLSQSDLRHFLHPYNFFL